MNESWRLAPWSEVLYACDGHWWRAWKGVPDFLGVKICSAGNEVARQRDLCKVTVVAECNDMLADEPGVLGFGGNSGFQALNLAVQFGANRIALVGFDMHTGAGVHWHGSHVEQLTNPTDANFTKWRQVLDKAATQLKALGVEVVNTSSVSALTAYEKIPLGDVLERWR